MATLSFYTAFFSQMPWHILTVQPSNP